MNWGPRAEIIWRNVMNGVGSHGDFLKLFAEAFIRADPENRLILMEASRHLIIKYNLDDSLHLSIE